MLLSAPAATRWRSREPGGAATHVWYRAESGEVGNRKWALDAPSCGGDIRGSNGFVVLWDPAAVADGITANFAAAPAPSLRCSPEAAQRTVRHGPGAVLSALAGCAQRHA